MTKISALLCGLFLFIYSGCSSGQLLTHEKGNDSVFAECANSIKGRAISVEEKNGNSWKVNDAILSSDTLKFFDTERGTQERKTIPLAAIKDFEYQSLSTSDSTRSIALSLKNGDNLMLHGVRFSPEGLTGIYRNPIALPVRSLSFIRYKEHTYATLEGVLAGTVIGAVSIILAHPSIKGKDDNAKFFGSPFPLFSGALIGGVTGWFVGHTVTYRVP